MFVWKAACVGGMERERKKEEEKKGIEFHLRATQELSFVLRFGLSGSLRSPTAQVALKNCVVALNEVQLRTCVGWGLLGDSCDGVTCWL